MSRYGKIRAAIGPIAGKMRDARVTTYAGSVVYHIMVALPSALMLLVSLIRYLPVTQEEVMKIFSDTSSGSVFSFFDSLTSSIFNSDETTTVISSLLLLVSASGALRSLMKGLVEVYGSKRKQPFLIFAIRAVFYTLVLIVTIVLSLLLLVYGSGLLDYLRERFPDPSLVGTIVILLQKIRYLLLIAFLTVVFMFFYDRFPGGKRKIRNQFKGALFSAVSWAVFSWGYSIYVSVSDKFGAYGYLGTIMVVMMWMYYCMMFFLLGGCINACAEAPAQAESVSEG